MREALSLWSENVIVPFFISHLRTTKGASTNGFVKVIFDLVRKPCGIICLIEKSHVIPRSVLSEI